MTNTTEYLITEIFGLHRSANTDDVKQAYKRLVKTHHPDVGGDPIEFVKIQKAWEELKPLLDSPLSNGFGTIVHTVSGELLTELGLGLGPTVNGTPCQHCLGNGYTAFTAYKETCDRCRGTGWNLINGCLFHCEPCGSTGSIRERKSFAKCWECHGTGEIEVLNPVIPKGRLR